MVNGKSQPVVNMARKPPSRIKYEQSHPVVSVRVTKPLKKALDSQRGERSYAELIREALEKAHGVREAYQTGYEEGYGKAEYKFKVEFACKRCNRPIPVCPGTKSGAQVIEAVEKKFSHKSCP